MKAVTLLINSMLPPDLRDDTRVFDKDSLENVLAEVARRYPNKYAEIAGKISDAGRHATYLQGETLTLNDLRPVIDKDKALSDMDAEIAAVNRAARSPEEAEQAKLKIWSNYADTLEKATITEALRTGNNLGNTVISKARGNPFQLKAMITTPALYTDYKDRPIPLFIRRSFGEGLRPYEYLASSFGVRKGVISTKNATAKGGYFSKMLTQSAANVVVTDDDCGTANGVDYDVDDSDINGRVLARDYKDFKAGTVIDKRLMSQMRKAGVKKVLARSPMTCTAKEGICAHCLGALPDGKFAPLGYSAGITAAQAIGEPLTQGALNTKHTAGGFTGNKKTFGGLDVLNQIVQSPETFPHRAAVAEKPGRVEKIEDAPQGGKFIYVAGEQHFAMPGYEPTVKPGDEVEEGDQLSEGIMDVADVVRLRGLGEARRYYVDRMRQALIDSGAGKASKTNLEVLARASLDHVRIDDPDGLGDYLPDDTASYNRLATVYSPPRDAALAPVEKAVGKYLQAPVLHYTIGTKLTPRMAKQIQGAGFANVSVSGEAPKFVPEMTRLGASAHSSTDWLAKMHTSYLSTNLQHDAERARDTNVEANTHFAPRLMAGKDFGKKVEQTGKF